MKEPRLTEQAKNDLLTIWYKIASDRDKKTADRVTGKIFDKCRSYTRFPESGRLRAELAPGLRSFAVEPYVVFYRPFGETISVIRNSARSS
jgi:toxin ParE1/3/4